MTLRPFQGAERRRFHRIEPKGSVMIQAGPRARHERILNLGGGGLLASAAADRPALESGCIVELELRLDGGYAEWVQASGRVVRVSAEGTAIAFDGPLPELARVIDEMATASHAWLRVISVILVDADPARRQVLAASFRSVGCLVIETSTPLEAIVRLGESSFEFNVVAIADSTPTMVSDELRRFVERSHPEVKLVAIGGALVKPSSGGGHWLSSADSTGDLAARIRDLLGRHQIHP